MSSGLNNEVIENDITNYSRYKYLNALRNLFYYIIVGKTEIRDLKKKLLKSLGFNIRNLFSHISNQSSSAISLIDFETYLNNNNIKYKEPILKRLIRQYDKKDNFNLSFEDFYNFINYPANIMITDNIAHKITETQKKIFSEILNNELEIIEKIGEVTSGLLNDINFTCYEAFMKISDNKRTFDGNDLFIFLGDEFDYDVDVINDVIYFMDKKGNKMITYEEFQDLFLPLTINNPSKVCDNYNNTGNINNINIDNIDSINNTYEFDMKKIKNDKTENNVNIDNNKCKNINHNSNNDINIIDEKNDIDDNDNNNFNYSINNENNYALNNFDISENISNKNCSLIVTAGYFKNKNTNYIDNNNEFYKPNSKLNNNCTEIVTKNINGQINSNRLYFDEFNKITKENFIINRNILNQNINLKKYFILENKELIFQSNVAFSNQLNQVPNSNNRIDKNRNNLDKKRQLMNHDNNDNKKLTEPNFPKICYEEIKGDDKNKNNFSINNCNSFSCINRNKNENSEIKNIITNENQFSIEKDIENSDLIKSNNNNNKNDNITSNNNNSNNKQNNFISDIFSDIVHTIGNYKSNNSIKNNYKINLKPEEERIINEYNNLSKDISNNYTTNNIFNNSNYNINKSNRNIRVDNNIPESFLKTYDSNITHFGTTRPYQRKKTPIPKTTLNRGYSYKRKHLKYSSQKNLNKLKNDKSIENVKINEEEKNNTKINHEPLYKNVYSKVNIKNRIPSNIIQVKKNKNISLDITELSSNINNKSANTIINHITNPNNTMIFNNNKYRNSMTVFSHIKDNDFSLIPNNEPNYRITETSENKVDLVNSFIDFIQIIVKNETEIENFKDNFSLKGIFALKSLFTLFDKDVNDFITEKSFRAVCRTKFGLFPTKDQIFLLFRRYDSDKDGKINLRDFLKMICPIKKEYMSILFEKNKKNNFSGLTKKGINYFSELLKCLIEKETQYYLFKYKLTSQKQKKWSDLWNILIKYNSLSFYEVDNQKKISKNDLKCFFDDNLYFLTSYQIDLVFHFFRRYGNKEDESKNLEEKEQKQNVEYITYDEFINVINLN